MNLMEFQDWITNKYVQWRGDAVGHERTISEFAQELGISQPLLSQWMSGTKRPRSRKSISQLIKMFGNEAYTVLGLPLPDDERDFQNLDSYTQDEAIEIIHRLAALYNIPVEIRWEDEEHRQK